MEVIYRGSGETDYEEMIGGDELQETVVGK